MNTGELKEDSGMTKHLKMTAVGGIWQTRR